MTRAFYNENDPYAAQWLRNLISAGELPEGIVDERSIEDIEPGEFAGYTQVHFFAGIGGWPYALRLAGWPDDQLVWTGSCPCQPLSSAGQRKGHADRRHLWPAFYRLIAECRPATIFGEQVAGTLGREWFSAVRADLEHGGYACGCADLTAASVGAYHIRQRLFWVAARRRAVDSKAARSRKERLDGSCQRVATLTGWPTPCTTECGGQAGRRRSRRWTRRVEQWTAGSTRRAWSTRSSSRAGRRQQAKKITRANRHRMCFRRSGSIRRGWQAAVMARRRWRAGRLRRHSARSRRRTYTRTASCQRWVSWRAGQRRTLATGPHRTTWSQSQSEASIEATVY